MATEEQLRRLALRFADAYESERSRVSRQLHDDLGQTLTMLKMNCSWLAERIKDAPPATLDKLTVSVHLADEAIRATRRLSSELRPGILSLGIGPAVEWLVEEFSSQTGIPCEVQVCEEDDLTDEATSTELYRILQEALSNIRKHAETARVRVTLMHSGDQVVLRVQDTGKGISDGQIASPGSLGILEMSERATRVGGAFTIQGRPGAGTTVTVFAPARR